jgi:uracil-DNA glycosylase family 4
MSTIWPLRNTTGPTNKPESCKTCPLYGNGKGFGFPETGGTNGVMVVVESLGEQEALRGGPLLGPAGTQFNHIIKRAGIMREEFNSIDNVLHCRPPGNKLAGMPYEVSATQHCAVFLDDTVAQNQPKAIIAMGGIPLKRMAGISGGITRNRGFVFEGMHNIPVVGTFHPSYLLPRKKEKSSAKYTWVVIMDIRKAIRAAAGKRDLIPQSYLMDPGIDRAKGFINELVNEPGNPYLGWDLETLYKLKQKNEQKLKLENKQVITRISFAFRPGFAMTVPHEEPYLSQVIKPLMAMNVPKVGHNSHGFDEPIVLLQEGWEVNGTLFDNMDAFHTLQPNLERNLEFVASLMTDHLKPWKHLSQSEPEWYSCQDSDATITSFLRILSMMKSVSIPDYQEAVI